jgi:hypothetical protein
MLPLLLLSTRRISSSVSFSLRLLAAPLTIRRFCSHGHSQQNVKEEPACHPVTQIGREQAMCHKTTACQLTAIVALLKPQATNVCRSTL